MSDGANLGVSAGRALETILGGEPEPPESERLSVEQMELAIRSRPLPGDGPKPFELDEDNAYSIAADCLAHAFLVLADEDPGLLTEQRFYTEADFANQDGDWWHSMVGTPRDPTDAIWEAFGKRWPDGDGWLGGVTGFMVGWAFNAVRTIKGLGPTRNPAIL